MANPGRPATGGNGPRGRQRSMTCRPPGSVADHAQAEIISAAGATSKSSRSGCTGPTAQSAEPVSRRPPTAAGSAPTALKTRMLPGRSPDQEPICRDCAGITTTYLRTMPTRNPNGSGPACVSAALSQDDLTAVLKPGDDLRLHRLSASYGSRQARKHLHLHAPLAPRPGHSSNAIGDRTLPLTHEAFDALPRSAAAEHLRYLLVHHRMMPGRGNETLVRFEQWLATKISNLPKTARAQNIERSQHGITSNASGTKPQTRP